MGIEISHASSLDVGSIASKRGIKMETGLPPHLARYVVTQDYSLYTPVDQSVWRYILRQLRAFLSEHAHPCYLEGLKKTGISVDRIPKISDISRHLEAFGWRAMPVSGFIPPAAFMELQALGVLPIASDMRTLEHLMYTPAPDIVHEAAGHAPILIEERFSAYLREYAAVARKAIISREDMDQYDAIRALSDLKEHPQTTPEQLAAAHAKLDEIVRSVSHISEAARLSRMNWWTAEYGLIGSREAPKIYGAGLLSSVGEARSCLAAKVRKIPLTIECVEYSYDITEPQPQLFVTPDFDHLSAVLEELARTMAFRTGGIEGLNKAVAAATVNTIELDSGLQISGKLIRWTPATQGAQPQGQRIAYVQFQGPTQLCENALELTGHGTAYHAHGFGSPLGFLRGHAGRPLAEFSDSDLRALGAKPGERLELEFESGVRVHGRVSGWQRSSAGRLLLITFQDCKVTLGTEFLFQPEWGTFDLAVGAGVVSVFGGPADRPAYGETDDFNARRVPVKNHDAPTRRRFDLYQAMREIRESAATDADKATRLTDLLARARAEFPNEWLLQLEALEAAERMKQAPPWKDRLRQDLEDLAKRDASLREPIQDGLKLLSVP